MNIVKVVVDTIIFALTDYPPISYLIISNLGSSSLVATNWCEQHYIKAASLM